MSTVARSIQLQGCLVAVAWLAFGCATPDSVTDLGDKGGAYPLLPGVPSILSPVVGPFRVTRTENPECNNHPSLWTFCQHQTVSPDGTGHGPGRDPYGTDATYAWDINLSGNADGGAPVYAVEPGLVVKFAGSAKAGTDTCKSVLIQHTTNGTTWWSGYLHMGSVLVQDGQTVSTSAQIGNIGSSCAGNQHLHLAAYIGTNAPGGLLSRDVSFVERTNSPGQVAYSLTVIGAGTGSGFITSNPSGFSCSVVGSVAAGTCALSFPTGTVVMLSATAAGGHTFSGWSGACSGTGNCVVNMTQARSVAAGFSAPVQTHVLAVSATGSGSGTLVSSPGGISCSVAAGSTSGTCSASFNNGTTVTLTAAPAGGHTFSGWSGACSGTGNCVVNMTHARSVTASFSAPSLLPAPTLIGPPNIAVNTSRTPTFSWSSVNGANRYWLTVSTTVTTFPSDANAKGCLPPGCTISGTTTATSHALPNPFPVLGTSGTLAPNTTYYWRVQAWNTNGTQGAYSAIFVFRTGN